jgi:hypothetical protein
MIDNLSLGITHALMLIAIVRLLFRADLDKEGDDIQPVKAKPGWGKRRDEDA